MPSAASCNAMTDYFVKAYESAKGYKPLVNHFTARWGFDSVLRDLNTAQAKKLVDFYLTTQSVNDHSLQWFFYHYTELIQGAKDALADRKNVERMMKESEKRAKEWKDKIDNQRVEGN